MKLLRMSCITLIILLFSFIFLTNAVVLSMSTPHLFSLEDSAIAEGDVILVLGAGLKEDGTPNVILRDRLDTALALYEKKLAPRILLSGDHSGDYNEVGAMYNYLLAAGVPDDAMILDETGFSTSASIDGVQRLCGKNVRLLIVTQRYHLSRAVALALAAGIEADGVAAESDVFFFTQCYRELREIAARTKDFFNLF